MISAIISNMLGLFMANYVYGIFFGRKEEVEELLHNPWWSKTHWARFYFLSCGAGSVWLGLYMTGRTW